MDSSSQTQGYVYQQQVPEPRPRKPGRPSTPRKPKPTGSSQVGQRYFLANMRTLLLVVVGMGLICGFALLIAHQVKRAQLKENERLIKDFKTNIAALEAAKPRGPIELFEGELATMRPDEQTPAPPESVNLDTLRKALYHADMARAAMKSRDFPVAVERYRQALDLAPFLHKVWAELGWTYLEMRDAPRAQIALERAVEGDPKNPEVLCHLGLSYLNQQLYPKAMQAFETAQQMDASFPLSHLYLAQSYLRQLDLDQAVIHLERYLRMVPNDPVALRERAYIYARRSQYNQALDNLRKAIAERPNWDELYWDSAAVCALLGRVDDAIRYVEKGEAFTDPSAAYKIWLTPPFEVVRRSASGRIFERELADRARRLLQRLE